MQQLLAKLSDKTLSLLVPSDDEEISSMSANQRGSPKLNEPRIPQSNPIHLILVKSSFDTRHPMGAARASFGAKVFQILIICLLGLAAGADARRRRRVLQSA